MTLSRQQVLDLPEVEFGPTMRRMRFVTTEGPEGPGGPPRATVIPFNATADTGDGRSQTTEEPPLTNEEEGGSQGQEQRQQASAEANLTGTSAVTNDSPNIPSTGTANTNATSSAKGGGQCEELWACHHTCSVCLEDFEAREMVRVLVPCAHVFHTDCIMPWLTEKRGRCPLCQQHVWRRRRDAEGSGGDPSVNGVASASVSAAAAGASSFSANNNSGDVAEENEEAGGGGMPSASPPAVVEVAEFEPESASFSMPYATTGDDAVERAHHTGPLLHMPPNL